MEGMLYDLIREWYLVAPRVTSSIDDSLPFYCIILHTTFATYFVLFLKRCVRLWCRDFYSEWVVLQDSRPHGCNSSLSIYNLVFSSESCTGCRGAVCQVDISLRCTACMFSIKCEHALWNFYLQSRNVLFLLLYILGVQQIRVSGEILLALELVQLTPWLRISPWPR